MIDVSSWITTALINGTKRKQITPAFARIRTIDYLNNGTINEEQVDTIATEIDAFETAEIAAQEAAEATDEADDATTEV